MCDEHLSKHHVWSLQGISVMLLSEYILLITLRDTYLVSRVKFKLRNRIGLGVMLLSEYILLIAFRNTYLNIMCEV